MVLIIFIKDILTFFFSILGIMLSIGYIYREAFLFRRDPDPTEKEHILEWINRADVTHRKERVDMLLADYAGVNEKVGKGQNVTYVTGTILIVASFTLLGAVASLSCRPTSAFSLASIGLLIIWLFVLQVTGKKADKIYFEHLRSIESALTKYFQEKDKDKVPLYSFGTHNLYNEKTDGGRVCWVRVRAMTWAFVLLILSLSWFLLSVNIRICLI